MLTIPHLLAGAALGKALRRPWLAWPVAFGSHFLLDYTPHLDSHALFGAGANQITTGEAVSSAVDASLGIGATLALTAGQPARRLMLGGACCAVLMDFLDNIPPWGDWFSDWGPTAAISAFHHRFQHNVTPDQWPLGFGTQLVVIALAVCVLRARSNHKKDPGEQQE